ncbi:hypothetical protein BJY00DRAFT_317413 [Aspergillus carlsbadensis]|nr:hypothetical protein BJY00DRAFT_317413 [Aspergillus carlsbadensis]
MAVLFLAATLALYDIILEVRPKPSTTLYLLAQRPNRRCGNVDNQVPIVLSLLQDFRVKTWLKITATTTTTLCVSGT